MLFTLTSFALVSPKFVFSNSFVLLLSQFWISCCASFNSGLLSMLLVDYLDPSLIRECSNSCCIERLHRCLIEVVHRTHTRGLRCKPVPFCLGHSVHSYRGRRCCLLEEVAIIFRSCSKALYGPMAMDTTWWIAGPTVIYPFKTTTFLKILLKLWPVTLPPLRANFKNETTCSESVLVGLKKMC